MWKFANTSCEPKANQTSFSRTNASPVSSLAFTLVELLIALFIVSLLAAIALPTVKEIVDDQKSVRTVQNIAAFIDVARNRAIAEQRNVGVRIERLNVSTPFGRSASLQLRQLTGVPPYSGDASDAMARLQESSGGAGIDEAEFDAVDCPLIALSSEILRDSAIDDELAPVKIGDLLELPGGRCAPITTISDDATTGNAATTVTVSFDLTERTPATHAAPNVPRYPSTVRSPLNTQDPVKFRIHRSPTVSSTAVLTMPRGVAIDLNLSGFTVRDRDVDGDYDDELLDDGNSFAPFTNSTAEGHIDIVFGPGGEVTGVREVGDPYSIPDSTIYLCIGKTDGIIVFGEDLYQNDRRGQSNLMDLDSVWLVINPNSGHVRTSPFASIDGSTIKTTAPDNQDLTKLAEAVREARELARSGVSLEGN